MGRKKKALKPTGQSLPQPAPQENSAHGGYSPWLRHALVAASLFLVTLLAYSNSFRAAFAFDNSSLILDDPRVHKATTTNVDLILSHTYWWPRFESGLYRPITTLSYLFNYAILGNGDHPAGYHWMNLFLHALNVFLVYLLALRLLRRLWPAVFIAAVWAVHPVLTESVTNIIGRADLLAGLALLSGLLMYLKSTESTGWHRMAWLGGLMAVTTLGVFSKESAVAILGVVVFYELVWWKERKQLRGLVYGCAAIAPPLLMMWYQRSVVLAATGPSVFLFVDNPLIGTKFLAGRLTAVVVMAKYLWLLVWPLKLSSDYSYNQIPIASGTPHDWIAWIAVLAVILAAASMFKRNSAAFFFAGFAFLSFIPVSNMIFFTGTIMAERFLYVPAIGFAGCLVLVTYWIDRRIGWPAFAPIALCLAIAALGFRTWERNFDWHDDLTLWTAAVRVSPNSFKGHDALAYVLDKSDPTHSNIFQVIEEEDKSLAILDSLPDSLNNADVYANAGRFYTTEGDALQLKGPNGEAKDTPESRRAYEKALEILLRGVAIDRVFSEAYRREEIKRGKPESEILPTGVPQLYDRLGLIYLRFGKSQDAYDAAVYARLLSPQTPDAYIVMGKTLILSNRKEDAAVALMEGLLVTGDPKFVPLLQSVYQSGLDPQGCAFTQTAKGPFLNNSCEPVHKAICKASSELMTFFGQTQHQSLADAAKNKALLQFKCSSDELQ